MDLLLGYMLCFYFTIPILPDCAHLQCVGNDSAAKDPNTLLKSFLSFFSFYVSARQKQLKMEGLKKQRRQRSKGA